MNDYSFVKNFGIAVGITGTLGAALVPEFRDYLNTATNPHHSTDLIRYCAGLMLGGNALFYIGSAGEREKKERIASMNALEQKLT